MKRLGVGIVMITTITFAIIGQVMAQEIGLQLYSVRDQMKTDVAGTHALVAEWGVHAVEGGGTYDMSMEDYQKLLKENDLKMVSVGGEFQELKDNPEAVIERAKAFGAKYAVCFWIPHKGDEFDMDDIKLALKVFENAGKMMKKEGITLCYHPHGYEFRPYKNGTLFDYMINKSKNFEYEMDVFWVKHPGADPLQLLRDHPDRFPLMHMKDRAIGTKGNQNGHADVETNVILGEGDVGMKALYLEAKKLGVVYTFIEDESSRSVQQIPESLKFLKALD